MVFCLLKGARIIIALLSKNISNFFVINNIIPREDIEVYEYSLGLLFSTILNTGAVLAISIATGTFFETVLFLIGFITLRTATGGFHAKNHFRCFVIFIATYLTFLAALFFTPAIWQLPLIYIFAAISSASIVLFAPIENKNKPLSEKEFVLFRRKSRINLAILLSIVIVLCLVLPEKEPAFAMMLGIFAVSCSILVSTINSIFNSGIGK